MKMQGPYWCYTHTCPNGMVYVGYSSRKDTNIRWAPSRYKNTSLQPYIEEFGWESIEHFFIDGIQTKESALELENNLIKMYREMGCCINQQGSGGLCIKDKKEYNKQHYKEHEQYYKEQNKQYYKEHKKERCEYQKRYKEEHREELKEYKKRYRESHREELKEKAKLYRESHKNR